MIKIQITHAKIKLIVETKKVSCDYVLIDKMRVQQVLINLLTNAIKFSLNQGVVIIRSETA